LGILPRAELAEPSEKPLEGERWPAASMPWVGYACRVLAQLAYGGSVAAVGLAGGHTLETTVIPFLLRGVSLLGIDSVACPHQRRLAVWRRIATDLPGDKLDALTTGSTLADLPRLAGEILEGRVRGRVVVDVNPRDGREAPMVVGMLRIALASPRTTHSRASGRWSARWTERIRNRFHLSVAEVDANDDWHRAVIGVACVSNDSRHADEILAKVASFVEGLRMDAELLDYQIELVHPF